MFAKLGKGIWEICGKECTKYMPVADSFPYDFQEFLQDGSTNVYPDEERTSERLWKELRDGMSERQVFVAVCLDFLHVGLPDVYPDGRRIGDGIWKSVWKGI